MQDMEAFVANEAMPDLSLTPDSRFPCSLGEKGILRQWNKCNTPCQDIIDFKGGCAFNVVLDYVEVVLKHSAERMAELTDKIGDNSAYTVTETADGNILLTAAGASKHAASPEGSVNATVQAAKLLTSCSTICESDRKVLQTVVDHFEDYYGSGMGIAYEEEYVGKLTCANGMVKMEDGHLCVSLDIRYGTGMAPERLEQLLDCAWQKTGWALAERVNDPGFKVDPNSPIPALLTQTTREITGADAVPYWMAGGTYSRHLKNAFTVGASAEDPNSTTVAPEMPAGHGGAHQRDEYCTVDCLMQGIRLLVHCILACDQALHN
jgi:succinyl-diaminopimelate desuccinylase